MEGTSFIDFLQSIDQSITLFINSFHSVQSDQFWQFCSEKAAWIPLYIFAFLFMMKKAGWKRSLVFILAAVIGFMFCDQLSTVVKNYVSRLRPNYNSETMRQGLIVLESNGGFYGFFSAHAANAFCSGLCYCKAMKPALNKKQYMILSIVIYLWASLIAISRVFVGKHYFGDVLTGSIVGLAIGLIMSKIAEVICRHFIGHCDLVNNEKMAKVQE